MHLDKNAPGGGAWVADRPADFQGWEILSARPMLNLAKSLCVHMRRVNQVLSLPEFKIVYTNPDLLRIAKKLHLTVDA